MSRAYDVIVIGAGLNGLVTAALLARAKRSVLVLERRETSGGVATTKEVYPGFRYDVGLQGVGWLHPEICKALRLKRHGLEIVYPNPTVFAPLLDPPASVHGEAAQGMQGGGDHLLLWQEIERSVAAIRRFSKADAEAWPAFSAQVARITGFLQKLYAMTPPRLPDPNRSDQIKLLQLGWKLRRLGKQDLVQVMRVLPMSVAEFLDEWFETDVLKGVLGAAGVTNLMQGPLASGTAYMFLHHHVGSPAGAFRPLGRVRGGVGKLAEALVAAARELGVEIRTEAEVGQVLVSRGRATGVALADGEEIAAQQVVSSADPRRTFLDLVDALYLEPSFVRKVRNIKYRGACARVNLALDGLPNFSALPGDGPYLHGVISISPSLHYLERAYDDAKYGAPSRRPYLQVMIPSLTDPTLAPEGQHVMTVLMQYAPYCLKDGVWDGARREMLGDAVVKTLAQYAPNLPDLILHRQVLTPQDLAEAFALTEGHLYHGELTLDQFFFMRPVPGWAQYRTPIEGLYLCGSGTHPGGGVPGLPGYNAAREILRDAKRSR